MTPLEIKIELVKKGVSMSGIGRQLEPPVSPVAVSRVIRRDFVSRRIMSAVADAISKDVKYVFPEYFLKQYSETKKTLCC